MLHRGRRATGRLASLLATFAAIAWVASCQDAKLTEPTTTAHPAISAAVVQSSIFPTGVSTTGIPFIRGPLGALVDMSEPGWAVGSRRDPDGLLRAKALNIRTGDSLLIGKPPGVHTQSKAINARGEIVGGEPGPGFWPPGPAFHWRNGVLTELGPGAAMDVNDGGLVVGYRLEGFSARPWVWREGEVQFLSDTYGQALAVNERGEVVGVGLEPAPGSSVIGPLIWRNGQATALMPGRSGQANAINNRGQIVGSAIRDDPVPHYEAFLWQDGVVTWLGTLVPVTQFFQYSTAKAINDRGQIVGDAIAETGYLHAVLWENGQAVDLGLAPESGDVMSSANGVTNSGQVIGAAGYNPGVRRGMIWTPGAPTQ